MKKICFLIAFLFISAVTAYGENLSEYEELISYVDLTNPSLSSVKECADAGDYESAVREFISYYIDRKTPVWHEMPREAGFNGSYNTNEADNIKNLLFEYNGELISADNGDGTVNWNLKPGGINEWMWRFNRQFQFVTLSRAYLYTGNTEYALVLESQFNDWYENNPKPTVLDTSGTWRTLEAGIRIGSSMISYFNNVVMCSEVSLLTKTKMLISLHEHGEYLSDYCGTNNWLIMECKGFYSLVYMFPEFKESQHWKNIIYNRIDTGYLRQFLDDGWQYELTPNYHIESVKSMQSLWDMALKNGDELPYANRIFKSYFAARALMGAGTFVLPLNDTHDVNQSSFMYEGAMLAHTLGDDSEGEFIAAATNGLYGKNDYEKSEIFQNSGYISMYGNKNDIHAFLETGPSGTGGHGWMSRDKLQFILSAFDRDLLIETGGSTTYADDPLSKYTYTTPAHNTVTIDGYDQIRRNNTDFSPDDRTVFISSDRLKYAQGVYDEKYDETALVDVVHTRKTAFVDSEYFVVRDELSGRGEHTARQYWNIAPGKYVTDSKTGIVHTDFEDGKNVMIIPANFKAWEINCGNTSPMRGWTSDGAKILNLCYKESFNGSLCMDAVIIPYESNIVPEAAVTRNNGNIVIKYKNYTDTVIFNDTSFTVERIYADKSTEIIEFDSKSTEDVNKIYPVIPTVGIVQAEWSGFENIGTCFNYNADAYMNTTVSFTPNSSQVLRTGYGVSAVKVKAMGEGVLDINGNRINVSGEEFCDYTVYGVIGGKIQVSCLSGNVEVDCYEFLGCGEKINLQAVRQRVAQSGTVKISNAQVTRLAADFIPLKSLSYSEAAGFGIKAGQYSVKYNMRDSLLELYNNDTLIGKSVMYMYSQTPYTLAIEVKDGVLSASVDEKIILSCSCGEFESGASLINEYMEMYIDNVDINNSITDYEKTAVGTAALSSSGFTGIVEGIENQYSDMKIICGADRVLPGTTVKLMLNNADGAQLIRNGKAVNFKDGQYSFAAENGDNYFTLKKDDCVSDTVKIIGDGDFYNEEEYIAEDFCDSSLNGNWSYGELFYPSNGRWYMEGRKGVQAEALITLPTVVGGKTEIESTFIPDSVLSEINMFIIRDSGGRELKTISFAKDGTVKDSNTGDVLGAYSPLCENKIRLELDFNNKTYTVYNNGRLICSEREMPNKNITGLRRVYIAKIWNGNSGTHISDFRISRIDEFENTFTISRIVGESAAVNESIITGNDTLYKAVYNDAILTSVQAVSQNILTADEIEYTLFDWDNSMKPYRHKRVCYFSLTPAFGGEGYFYQNFDNSSLGSRWGCSTDYISVEDGMLNIKANKTGSCEVFYNCLDNLNGRISIEAEVIPETEKTSVALFTYRGQDGGETQLLTLGSDGKIYSSGQKAVCLYHAGEKNKIRVAVDTENGFYDIWNNNRLLAGNIPLIGTAAHIRRMYVAKIYKGNSGIKIDNFIISKNCK